MYVFLVITAADPENSKGVWLFSKIETKNLKIFICRGYKTKWSNSSKTALSGKEILMSYFE